MRNFLPAIETVAFPPMPFGMHPWIGPAAASALAALLLLAGRWGWRCPDPGMLFALALVLSAYLGGILSGLLTAVIALAYTLNPFTLGHGNPLASAAHPFQRSLVPAICLPAMAILVGLLKERAEFQRQAINRKLADLPVQDRDCGHETMDQPPWPGARPEEGVVYPVCAWCHKVREKDGSWIRLETHFTRKYGARITHGICPECRPGFSAGSRSPAEEPCV